MTHCSPQILFAELTYNTVRESEWRNGIRTVRARVPDGQWITGKWTGDFDDALQHHPAIIAAARCRRAGLCYSGTTGPAIIAAARTTK